MTSAQSTATATSRSMAASTGEGGLGAALQDGWVVAKRNLIKIKRIPDLLIFTTIQPIMFVVLFAYVFGGAIAVQGGNYR